MEKLKMYYGPETKEEPLPEAVRGDARADFEQRSKELTEQWEKEQHDLDESWKLHNTFGKLPK